MTELYSHEFAAVTRPVLAKGARLKDATLADAALPARTFAIGEKVYIQHFGRRKGDKFEWAEVHLDGFSYWIPRDALEYRS